MCTLHKDLGYGAHAMELLAVVDLVPTPETFLCEGDSATPCAQGACEDPTSDGCNAADLAEPFNVLDLGDINAFVAGFTSQDPVADLAAPFGVFDLGDINAFVAAFTGGCP